MNEELDLGQEIEVCIRIIYVIFYYIHEKVTGTIDI
jgi:hypothetical protein